MAWVEMFLKFIVDIVHYAAWPLVMIGALYLFREPLRKKIRELIKIGHKDIAAVFDIPEPQRKILESGRFLPATKDTIDYGWYLKSTIALAMLIGALALELKKSNVKSRHLQLAKLSLAATLKRLKKDRPDIADIEDIEGLDVIETYVKLLNPKDEQKQ